MPYDSHGYTFEDAVARTADVYEVDFPSWGERATVQAGNKLDVNFQYPPPGQAALQSLAVAAIGPDSTVDRCWITWNRRKILNTVGEDFAGPITSLPRVIAVGAPVTFTSPGATGQLPDALTGNAGDPTEAAMLAMQRGLMYVYPTTNLNSDLRSNTTIVPYGGATTDADTAYYDQFGVARPFYDVINGYESPKLQLHLFPKVPAFAPPFKRAPMVRDRQWAAQLAAPRTRVLMIPVFGRKTATVSVYSAISVNVFVGLVHCVGPKPFGSIDTFEVAAGSLTNVVGSGKVALSQLNAAYLAVYITASANATGFLTVVAED